MTSKSPTNWLATGDSDDEDSHHYSSDDDRDASRVAATTDRASKRRRVQTDDDVVNGSDGDSDQEEPETNEKVEVEKEKDDSNAIITNPSKLKPLSKTQLLASKAATEKTGVVYLSRIPPFMKPQKVKHLLSQFGPVGRIFLAPESPKAHSLRLRFGGNKKRNFDEGWVEFLNKKHARLVADTLNANPIGGKKGNYYYDDVWNIKYLPKFKWHHLTEQIANENASRQARLRAEMSQATKENKTYIRNVERAKMVEKMQETKKRKIEESGEVVVEKPIEVRRQFKQRTSIKKNEGEERSDAMKQVLNNIF